MDTRKDHYKTLGVDKNASAAEIKKVYRNLAKKHHPDKHKGDVKAEDRFKEISDAYDVLGDNKKRQEYDTMRENPFAGSGGFNYQGGNGQRVHYEDVGGFGDLFGDLFGNRSQTRRGQTQQIVKAEERQIQIPLRLALSGGEYLYKTSAGSTVKLKIPKSCQRFHKIKLREHGQQGQDLILSIDFILPDGIEIIGNDVKQRIAVSVWDAVLGSKKEVQLYNGKTVNVNIKEASSSHHRLKLPKMGLINGDSQGDCYLELQLETPQNLTSEQKEMVQNLKYNS